MEANAATARNGEGYTADFSHVFNVPDFPFPSFLVIVHFHLSSPSLTSCSFSSLPVA